MSEREVASGMRLEDPTLRSGVIVSMLDGSMTGVWYREKRTVVMFLFGQDPYRVEVPIERGERQTPLAGETVCACGCGALVADGCRTHWQGRGRESKRFG